MIHAIFSVSYAGLWGQGRLDLLQFLDRVPSLGYGAVMLMGKRPHLSIIDMTAVEQIRHMLDKHGLVCPVIGAYTDFGGGHAQEVPWREMQVGYVRQLAEFGVGIGASVIRLFSSYESPASQPAVLWEQTVSGIRECCDAVADLGVTIAIQNHHDIGVEASALLELLTDIDRPNCRLGIDAWSIALLGGDLYDTARQLAPYTAITTNADYIRIPRHHYRPGLVSYEPGGPPLLRAVPFGDGFIDYQAFFKGLIDGGFDGVATYEMCSPLRGGGGLENLDHCARQYLRWVGENIPSKQARPSAAGIR